MTKKYNKKWHEETDSPLIRVKDAGHNSNTDCPAFINNEIECFLQSLRG